ncbi:glycosyltransferase [Cellulomonas citrea]|uniref:glycosyltransferase n=1 Tax=Cellulomonas citrea TaxID=1909423 RepID=UPI00135BA0D5|nr:glycosyltransferase [Cellulomonas citrea]
MVTTMGSSTSADEPLAFPAVDRPAVSVIIPVHGQWAYTQQCLRSLMDTTGDDVEIVVVDDASPDESLAELRRVPGVQVVALEVNRGFIGACNAGIAASRGELVVLLNNDTQVRTGWLDAMREAIADPTVGLVGAQLVYPDGRLQEAGGIIWSDGSGWNYGRLGNPEDPAVTYPRDVDYCSGAAIMLRRDFLVGLGGLDERYAPAYYDDADLAFAVRAAGLRVRYEPRAVVVHHEGVSHGTDLGSGVKARQVVNREVFARKWSAELAHQLSPTDPGAVERAARRRAGKDLVVVVDHTVPTPDQDAGSVRAFAMLEALRAAGHAVVFIPMSPVRAEPYTSAVQALGVEVRYGHHDLAGLLRDLAPDVIAAVVCRIGVAVESERLCREALPGVPLVFDTVDLHFLRVAREAQLRGAAADGLDPDKLREVELGMVQAADATLVVSPVEQELLAELVPGAPVHVLPTVHAPVADRGAPPDERTGLLFVGNFRHAPNADAVRWFAEEVLPLVLQVRPDVHLDVVGSHVPEDLVDAAPPQVRFLGWVPDLAELYGTARLAVCPLRFGAGVKGKVGESLAHGLPVVVTSVGAEGMGLVDGQNALLADDPQAFADAVLRGLSDDELWGALATAGRAHIDEMFGPRRFTEELAAVLEQVQTRRRERRPRVRVRAGAVAPQPTPAAATVDRPAASIVIPAWNGAQVTRACLDTLLGTLREDDQVIVVDNGSQDETPAVLAEFAPRVEVVRHARNLGFAAGCNSGADVARNPVVVYLNNDTLPVGPWLDRLLAPFADPAVGATGPMSNFVSGPQLYAPGRQATVRGLDDVRALAAAAMTAGGVTVEPVTRLVGFALAVRTDLVRLVGGFDTAFEVGGYEDDDLCRRLQAVGARLLMVRGSFVYHLGHATFDANGLDWRAIEARNGEVLARKEAAMARLSLIVDCDDDLTSSARALIALVDVVTERSVELVLVDHGAGIAQQLAAQVAGRVVVVEAGDEDGPRMAAAAAGGRRRVWLRAGETVDVAALRGFLADPTTEMSVRHVGVPDLAAAAR